MWNLRGMFCSKIQEYNKAISCYKKFIKLKDVFTSKSILEMKDFIIDYDDNKTYVIVAYDTNYINKTREMAKKLIKKCFIIVPINSVGI